MNAKVLLCDCAGSFAPDGDALSAATGLSCSRVYSGLCTSQIKSAAKAISDPESQVIVACQQEADTFALLAEELEQDAPLCVDIRDRAGWSNDGKKATPKMAALVAAAVMKRTPFRTFDIASEGICLIVGHSETVLPVAEQLAGILSVTCLLSDHPEFLPGVTRSFDVASGRLKTATGSFGGFNITVDGYRSVEPAGRGNLNFSAPQNGAQSECDLILDLTGNGPLFPAHEKRDGYLRADPGDIRAVQRAVFDASQLIGTFEKTLHVRMDESLCAHTRAGQTGCTRCLDVCPTGAITPAGDAVAIDAHVCAGCGACSSVCPSGAATYDAPPVSEIFGEIRTLASTYGAAGGKAPRLLVHDNEHGREMIALAARLGRGLPADVLPLGLPSLAVFGHAEMMVALACGFRSVTILVAPKADRETLASQAELTDALTAGLGAGEDRIVLLDTEDPDAMSDALYSHKPKPLTVESILPLGRRRDVTRLAARALARGKEIEPVALPDGAPYGAVLLDDEACTLCLSCASLCPSGALNDNPGRPQLRFQEDACLQCGLCVNVCPENAITLQPRLDISKQALSQQVLKEEEPYACIECGKPFGVKSTVERIVAKLEGQHSMFSNSDNTRLIRMCDDCRVRAQYHGDSAPFRMGDRPKVRTTDDYLNDRKKH